MPGAPSHFRCAVESPEALAALREAPLPLGLHSGLAHLTFHRDLYLDTADGALGKRGMVCRLRIGADDRRYLALVVDGQPDRPPQGWEAQVAEVEPRRALSGSSEPARRVRGLI